jgi:phage-related protein
MSALSRQVWIAKYYRNRQGNEPVLDYINGLPPEQQEFIDRQIDRLNAFGPMIPAPHSKQVKGKLRRLRCRFGTLQYRILYEEADSGLIVLLHAFLKKTPKIPKAEIAIAESRMNDFRARMNALIRVPPRAVGSDAP